MCKLGHIKKIKIVNLYRNLCILYKIYNFLINNCCFQHNIATFNYFIICNIVNVRQTLIFNITICLKKKSVGECDFNTHFQQERIFSHANKCITGKKT